MTYESIIHASVIIIRLIIPWYRVVSQKVNKMTAMRNFLRGLIRSRRDHLQSFFVDTLCEKIRTLRFEKHIFHSQLIRDSQENIANGLTVFNPLLVGAISSSLIPNIYGPFDDFSLLLIILGTIFRQVSIN